MRQGLLNISTLLLRVVTKLTLARHKPRIIGITGSVGKTSTKTAIGTVLERSTDERVRVAGGNLNNEIGLQMAILGEYEKPGGMMFGLGVFITSLLKLISPFEGKRFPEIIVLEYGADKPGDIRNLLKTARPDVAVVTAVGEVPVHVEFYDSPEDVAKEKATLIEGLKPGGAVILNSDDPAVSDMGKDSIHKIITFGFDEGADIRITNFRNRSDDGKPLGVSFKLETMEHSVPVRIDGVFGKSQAYAAAVAAAVASVEKINLVTAAEALALYKGEKGRMRLIPGIKQSYILDDTYNASPASSRAALDVLEDLEAQRKIAVLGDMLELGKYTESAHRELGRHAASIVDKLVTVGARSIFTAEGAKESGLPKEDILSFDTSDEAKIEVQKLIEKGDLVLVKGSQGIRMERVVLEIMAEPQKAKDLLVRQYGKWLLK